MSTAAGEASHLRIVCRSADTVWARDADATIVVDRRRGTSWVLDGAEAAIWDWLCLGHSRARIIRLLAALLDSSDESAQRSLSVTLERWLSAGLLALQE